MSNKQELIEYYIKNICKNCKKQKECKIVVNKTNEYIYTKCIEYQRNKVGERGGKI